MGGATSDKNLSRTFHPCLYWAEPAGRQRAGGNAELIARATTNVEGCAAIFSIHGRTQPQDWHQPRLDLVPAQLSHVPVVCFQTIEAVSRQFASAPWPVD